MFLSKKYSWPTLLAVGLTTLCMSTTQAQTPPVEDSVTDKIAQQSEVAPVADPVVKERLTLTKAIDTALSQNLGLMIERYNPAIAANEIDIEEAEFDPTLSAETSRGKNVAASASSVLQGAARPASESRDYSAGVSDPNALGGRLNVATNLDRNFTNSANATLNPDYSSAIGASYRQPILRGFGTTINLANVVIARSDLRQNELAVRRAVLDLLASVEIAYWNLSAAYAERELRESSVKLAEALLDETRERERLGVALRVDVLQAQASLATRLEEVIIAERNIEQAEDNLRELLGDLDLVSEADIRVAELPDISPELPPFRELISPTLLSDLELQIQHEEISQRELGVKVAENRLLPNLDLTAGGAYLGRDDEGYDAYTGAWEGKGYRWNVGAEISFPWGFRAERARYRQANRRLEQEQTRDTRIRQQLLLSLREAWRNVSTGKQRTVTTSASLELNEESFQLERARYEAGAATFRDVLESQRDLDNARIRHLEASFELIRADVRLARLVGTILPRNGFAWQEVDNVTARPPRKPPEMNLKEPALQESLSTEPKAQ